MATDGSRGSAAGDPGGSDHGLAGCLRMLRLHPQRGLSGPEAQPGAAGWFSGATGELPGNSSVMLQCIVINNP